MMVFTPLNEEVFDKSQVEMGYCKMFKHILEDFVTRKDAVEMMKSNNLPTNTKVSVPVSGQAGAMRVNGTAEGNASGVVIPVYNGEKPTAASTAMQFEKEMRRRAGGLAMKTSKGSS